MSCALPSTATPSPRAAARASSSTRRLSFDVRPSPAGSRGRPRAVRVGAASASDATKFDAILAELESASPEDFPAAVDDAREELTTAFYEHAAGRVAELDAAGDAAASSSLDQLCARVMAAADRSFGTVIPSIGDGSDVADAAADAGGALTLAQEAEVQRRFDALASKLAAEGETAALAQADKNATSRRDSVVAILGRVPMQAKELRALNMVTAERRIIDVLLTIPRGAPREEAITDAITPPESSGEDERGDGDEAAKDRDGGAQMILEDDEMLVGDEEEVFTTPARLLAATELAINEAVAAADDAAAVDELRNLRDAVAKRCDFL